MQEVCKMSILSVLAKPFIKKAKEDLGKLVKDFIEDRKHADEDGNGQEDYDQICHDGKLAVEGVKQTIGAVERIVALGVCYYLKYSPKQKAEAIASLEQACDLA